MGREIRRVPPNWEHPKDNQGNYLRLHDETFEEAVQTWKEGFAAWEAGTHEDFERVNRFQPCEFWEYEDGPPGREDYRPTYTEEPTWYQAYETVSEGTPITPPFATTEELIDYLCTYGDDAYRRFGYGSIPSREAASAFVAYGSVTSMVVFNNPGEPRKVMMNLESLEPEQPKE